ncbi:MAG: Bug family tripartite tricarboxylate transporter substrate binding protein [Comamonas sp.]
MLRRQLFKASCAMFFAAAGFNAHAQAFPNSTIRIVTPYDAGSTVDITSRLVADGLSKRLGQPVIVENRPGGQGAIGMNALLTSPANGYTLLTDTPASAINPSLYKSHSSRYNAATDLAPVAQLMSLPFAIAVSPKLPVKNIAELVALAKAKPGEINAAVAGTSTRLAGELFSIQNGLSFNPINYRGAMSAMQAVLKGETDVVFLDAANLAPYISAGQMRGLLITGDQRWPVLADVPTAKEAGFENFDVSTWFGIFAKSGTPQPILDQLNAAIRDVMASPELTQYLKQRGAQPSSRSANEFKAFFHQEINLWRDVIVKAKVSVE